MEKRYLVTKDIMLEILGIGERQLANLVASDVVEKIDDRYNLAPSLRKYLDFKGALRKDSSNEIVNTRVLSAILGISEKTTTDLALKNVIIRAGKDSYKRDESISNYIEYLRANLNKNLEGRTQELNKKKYDAELKELKLKELRKDLHRTEVVKDVIGRMIQNFRGKALVLPSKVAPVLAVTDERERIEEILREAVAEILEELSEWNPEPSKGDKDA
ncbi:MAG: hypothetical protein ACRCZO_09265 [Cetobacterium sp.]